MKSRNILLKSVMSLIRDECKRSYNVGKVLYGGGIL